MLESPDSFIAALRLGSRVGLAYDGQWFIAHADGLDRVPLTVGAALALAEWACPQFRTWQPRKLGAANSIHACTCALGGLHSHARIIRQHAGIDVTDSALEALQRALPVPARGLHAP